MFAKKFRGGAGEGKGAWTILPFRELERDEVEGSGPPLQIELAGWRGHVYRGKAVFFVYRKTRRGNCGIAELRNVECGMRIADNGETSNIEWRRRGKALQCRETSDRGRGMDYSKIITIEPGKRSGKPCIRGLRMTVTDVLEYLAGGMTHEELLSEFPDLTEEDIRACLAFAAEGRAQGVDGAAHGRL